MKILKKHLREIKPPFEKDSPRSSASSDGKVPSALLRERQAGEPNGRSYPNDARNTQAKEEVISSNDSNGEKAIAAAVPATVISYHKDADNEYKEPFKVDKVRKSAEKPYDDVNLAKNKLSFETKSDIKSQSSRSSSRSGEVIGSCRQSSVGLDAETEPSVLHYRSTPKYRVERHSPQKLRPHTGVNGDGIPEKKNLLPDLEDSIEIITAHGKIPSSGRVLYLA